MGKVLQSLQNDGNKYNWEMSLDGTITKYPEIEIEEVRTDKGKLGYQLTQEGLIKKIHSTTGMTDYNRNANPT